jgi:hypothetical protein
MVTIADEGGMWRRRRGARDFPISICDCSSIILRVAVRSLKTETHWLPAWQQRNALGTGYSNSGG